MKSAASLICPACHEALKGEFESYSVLRCSCFHYPIIEGIPILTKNPVTRKLSEYVGRGNTEEAFAGALSMDYSIKRKPYEFLGRALQKVLLPRTFDILVRWNQSRMKELVKREDFLRSVDVLTAGIWNEYLKFRFCSPSFMASIPFLRIVELKCSEEGFASPSVIEAGCGAGHMAFHLSRLIPEKNIWGLDRTFSNLFLAKRFLAPEANFLLADLDLPWPLNMESEFIFSNDVVHYLRDKKSFSGEVKSHLAEGGAIFLGHLHNSLAWNPYAGMPLDPRGYKALFDPLNVSLLSEDEIVSSPWKESLNTVVPQSIVDRSSALLLIFGMESLIPMPWGPFFRPHGKTIVNPIFSCGPISAGKNSIRIRRNCSESFLRDQKGLDNYLPPEKDVPLGTLMSILRGKRETEHELALLKQFVVIDSPPRYTEMEAPMIGM